MRFGLTPQLIFALRADPNLFSKSSQELKLYGTNFLKCVSHENQNQTFFLQWNFEGGN